MSWDPDATALYLVVDRLIGGCLYPRPDRAEFGINDARLALNEQEADHLLGRIDPAVGPKRAAPAERARRGEGGCFGRIVEHAHAQPKAIAAQVRDRPVEWKLPDMVGRHQRDGSACEQPLATLAASVARQHLGKARVVFGSASQPAAAAVVAAAWIS